MSRVAHPRGSWTGPGALPSRPDSSRPRTFTPLSALDDRVLDRASCRCHLCGGVVSLGTLLLMGDTCAPCCWGRTPGAWTPTLPFDAGESWYLISKGLQEAGEAPPRATAPGC